MELHGLGKVGKKIARPMIAGIEVKLVLYPLRFELPIQCRGARLKTKFVVLPAVEVDGEFRYGRLICFCQNEGAVLPPVRHVDGVPKS